jgi:RNA polymerase sigma-70 factor (ECF subfamily)
VLRTESHDPETFAGKSRPHQDAVRDELRQSLDKALQELPDRQRLIVSLFEIDGHSTEEVASMLSVSQVTVRWHLHQARRTLREALKGWME